MRAAGRDNVRMSKTRDAMVLALRAIREGFRVLRALGYSIVPQSIRIFERVPEPILVWAFRKRIADPLMRIAMLEHGAAAQDEIEYLANEFMALKRQTSVPTPAIDRLTAYFDPATPPLPEGSAEIPLDWRFLWVVAGVLAGIVVAVWLLAAIFG
jgi:2-dehydropantoate 2-reductase